MKHGDAQQSRPWLIILLNSHYSKRAKIIKCDQKNKLPQKKQNGCWWIEQIARITDKPARKIRFVSLVTQIMADLCPVIAFREFDSKEEAQSPGSQAGLYFFVKFLKYIIA
ncbi:MAG: hypothetical protein IKH30_15200 [Clostridia bacterium]|nr:hypothetical protein [Clostridia bacterium]